MPAVLDALRGAGFLRLRVPYSLGGLETDPVTVASVIEELAAWTPPRHRFCRGFGELVARAAA